MAGFSLDYSKYRVPQDGSFSLTDIDPADTQGLVRKQVRQEVGEHLAMLQKASR